MVRTHAALRGPPVSAQYAALLFELQHPHCSAHSIAGPSVGTLLACRKPAKALTALHAARPAASAAAALATHL